MNQQYEAPSEANPGWPTPLSSPRPRALETSAPISKLMSISLSGFWFQRDSSPSHNTRCRLPTDHRRVWFIVHVGRCTIWIVSYDIVSAIPSCDEGGESSKAIPLGMDSWTSVPAAGLLKILSTPPILVVRSRMPAKPQCPSRPFSSICGSIPHPLSRIRMRSSVSEYSSSNSTRFAPE
jgi:hypothetical protein